MPDLENTRFSGTSAIIYFIHGHVCLLVVNYRIFYFVSCFYRRTCQGRLVGNRTIEIEEKGTSEQYPQVGESKAQSEKTKQEEIIPKRKGSGRFFVRLNNLGIRNNCTRNSSMSLVL